MLFIGNLSHELRTPLSIIKAEGEIALMGRLSAPARKQWLLVVREADRIHGIIDNTLTLENLLSPHTLKREHVDLTPILHRVLKRHRALARERGIRMSVQRQGFRTAWGNASAIEQMLDELVRNALYYTPKHKGRSVTLTARPAEEGRVLIMIKDTGIGIKRADLPHIFEPFYRADPSRVRIQKSGAGLGLPLVREIVRAHQGKLFIESVLGTGTAVSVYLPGGLSRESTVGPSSKTVRFSPAVQRTLLK